MTGYSLEWRSRALKDADRLDAKARKRVFAALERLASAYVGDVVRIKGIDPPEYRLRVGTWRVRFSRDKERKVITVLRVLHRREAYR